MVVIDGVAYAFMGPTAHTNRTTGVNFDTDNGGGDLPGMPVTLNQVIPFLELVVR